MRDLAELPDGAWRAVRGVLTDIDDTLTTGGRITPEALRALWTLATAGIPVIAVTGRASGWCDAAASRWPLAAIVAENGAVALVPDPGAPGGRWRRLHAQSAATRAANRRRMQRALERVEAEVPGARRAADSAGRECDIAIDHGEFNRLPAAAVDRCVALLREAGMHVSVSSIHINGWYGSHDKFSGARWIVRELWSRELRDETGRWIYVGDSANDQVMFRHFAHSVGVANIRDAAAGMAHRPAWITRGERGAGFAEVAQLLLRQLG